MREPSVKNKMHTRGTLNICTPLGIVSIRAGLTDMHGRRVDSIAVTPDRYSGEKKIVLRGYHNTRLVELKGVKI